MVTYSAPNLLAKGSEQGIIGGITEAVVFATLNIGAALLFAIVCVRNLVHRSWLMKLFGLLGLAAYIVVALSVNLALAQYARELIVGCKAFIHHTPRNPKFVVRRVTDR